MRISYQVPIAFDPQDKDFGLVKARIIDSITKVKQPGTQFDIRPSRGMPDVSRIANCADRFQNDGAIFDSMHDAVATGIDGLVSACFFDSALWPARQKFEIPVAGLAESSLALAKSIGRRVAIMPVEERYVPIVEDMIDLYGFRTSAISTAPVRAVAANEAEAMTWFLDGQIERLVEALKPVARACIRDGADVLIVGCGLVSVLVSEVAGIREIDGVPLILPLAAATKAIETLVDLKAAGHPVKTARGFWGRL
jgi:allantoin racemase